jgi:hypothetical protein
LAESCVTDSRKNISDGVKKVEARSSVVIMFRSHSLDFTTTTESSSKKLNPRRLKFASILQQNPASIKLAW